MSAEEKKNADETLKIIEEIFDYNKNTRKFFPLDKGKSVSKKTIVERNIEESVN